MGITNIQWCARHTVDPQGTCTHGATGAERCLDVECERCWVKGYSANVWEGCTPVSTACKHCWAEAVAKRQGLDVWGPDKPRWLTSDAVFKSIASWNGKAKKTGQRRGVFWEDMGDLFEDRPELIERRDRAFEAMAAAEMLDHMLLTKRPENVLRMVPKAWFDEWPAQVWMGATIEDGATAAERMPHLAVWVGAGVGVTFVSAEPLLGNLLAVDPPLELVDLVIVGGESGPGARPMDLAAAEALMVACSAAGTPAFMKQMGSRWAQANGGTLKKGASHGQDPYRWPAWARRRELPEVR